MAKQNLVIVESPAKAKTIGKYLGPGFEVKASMGHIRDLPKSTLGVDVATFEPEYQNIKDKADVIRELKKAAKASDKVYLATDPDREGEAISWHLQTVLEVPREKTCRVTFNEITQKVVKESIANPRDIDQDLVDAQQARRVLDRIVGYQLSPLLWKKIRRGLSAGRVQSVATRLAVEREEEIRAFKPEEYWSIDAMVARQQGKAAEKKPFPAKYHGVEGKKAAIKNQEQAKAILEEVRSAPFVVSGIKKGVRRRSPAPPFITSTLQQDASRRLGFQAKRTMKVAQELYEGVEIDGLGAVGLITYMRTDSLRIADEALESAAQYIRQTFGDAYALQKPRTFKTKKNAQDAHEAIRPTMIELEPGKVKANLTSDQYKLYKLIWERFIATQMANALLDTVSVDISAGRHLFKASGFSVKFDGFTALYVESTDSDEESATRLPPLEEGEVLEVAQLAPNQHFTQPPPRFTEASLIKELEENGIGRPSTYASTLSTILQRGYVEREQKALKPTALGEVTTKLMKEQFKDIVDLDFTAGMEQRLDEVEDGKIKWEGVLSSFYGDFADTLKQAEKNMEGTRMKVPDEETDVVCELCGRKMVIKHGRYGKFLACPGFPECRNTKKLVQETPGLCPVCGKKVIAKKTKTGRTFYGCSGYPDCKFMTWDTPLGDTCPKCGGTLFHATGKMKRIHCLKEGCGFEKAAPGKKENSDG